MNNITFLINLLTFNLYPKFYVTIFSILHTNTLHIYTNILEY